VARRKSYTHTGRCIWCGKSSPQVSFKKRPHIVPDAVGGNEIGFDVCDECNEFFGISHNTNLPSPDQIFSALFNLKRFSPNSNYVTDGSKHKQRWFTIEESGILHIPRFIISSSVIGDLLKRAFYEIFLQKYHRYTKDGNNCIFDSVVSYARYGCNAANIKVYYVKQKMWLLPAVHNKTFVPMSKKHIKDMNGTGFFRFYFLGYIFYLEIFKSKCDKSRDSYFHSHLRKNSFFWDEIVEFNTLNQLTDFFNYLGYKIIID